MLKRQTEMELSKTRRKWSLKKKKEKQQQQKQLKILAAYPLVIFMYWGASACTSPGEADGILST